MSLNSGLESNEEDENTHLDNVRPNRLICEEEISNNWYKYGRIYRETPLLGRVVESEIGGFSLSMVAGGTWQTIPKLTVRVCGENPSTLERERHLDNIHWTAALDHELVTPFIPLVSELVLEGELVFKAHRLLYHATLGSRVIQKKKTICPVADF